MGNDGGSIPKRSELVKSASRTPTVSELKATALESLSHAWTHDALTSEPLAMEAVVSDWRGRLYNYETVLEGLMPGDDDSGLAEVANGDSQELTFASTGIKSLRDVVKLKFKRYSPPGDKDKEIWACPMSLKELGPATRAVYLVPCGHVFAEVGIRTIQEELCPECSEPFKSEDVIDVLPTEQKDVERLSKRIENLSTRGLTHSLKKDKSQGKKKRKANDDKKEGEGNKSEHRKDGEGPAKQARADLDSRVSGINNPMTASLTARVLAEQDAANKRRKLAAAR